MYIYEHNCICCDKINLYIYYIIYVILEKNWNHSTHNKILLQFQFEETLWLDWSPKDMKILFLLYLVFYQVEYHFYSECLSHSNLTMVSANAANAAMSVLGIEACSFQSLRREFFAHLASQASQGLLRRSQ